MIDFEIVGENDLLDEGRKKFNNNFALLNEPYLGTGIPAVTTLPQLPNPNYPEGKVISLNGILYINRSNTWVRVVNTIDLDGVIQPHQLAQEVRDALKSGVGIVDELPNLPNPDYPQGRIISFQNHLWISTGSTWEKYIPDIPFSPPVRVLTIGLPALPNDDYPPGSLVSWSDRLYENISNVWSDVVASNRLTGQLSGAQIGDNQITETKITNNAISAPKIQSNAVTADKIAANSVTANNIATGAVTADKIAVNAVIAEKIAANAVTAAKISAGAVETDKLAANAVTAVKIAAGAVETDKLAANAVTAAKIAAGAVTADKITANAVTADKLATNSVTTDKITANAVTAAKISANAVTADKIAANSIVSSKIAANAIEAQHLSAGAIRLGSIQDYQAQNLVSNPSFEILNEDGFPLDFHHVATGTIEWATQTSQPRTGLRCIAAVKQDGQDVRILRSEQMYPCNPGDIVTVWCHHRAAGSSGAQGRLRFYFYNANMDFLSGSIGPTFGTAFYSNGAYQKQTFTVTLSDTTEARYFRWAFELVNNSTGTGQGFRLDDIGASVSVNAEDAKVRAGTSLVDGDGLRVNNASGVRQIQAGNITGLPGVPSGTQYGFWGTLGSGVYIQGAPRVISVQTQSWSSGNTNINSGNVHSFNPTLTLNPSSLAVPSGKRVILLFTFNNISNSSTVMSLTRQAMTLQGSPIPSNNTLLSGTSYTGLQCSIQVIFLNLSGGSQTSNISVSVTTMLVEVDA